MNYDLEERCEKFGEAVILFGVKIKRDDAVKSLISQLIRSATSIGANYMEANQASSKKDFANKIRLSQKEANETKHWLRMIKTAIPNTEEESKKLWKEAHELTLIFAKISRSSKE